MFALKTSLQTLRNTTVFRVLRFSLKRLMAIAATIFVGVFITVVLANQSGQIEQKLAADVTITANAETRFALASGAATGETRVEFQQQAYERIADEIGLNLPYWPRHLLWTLNALRQSTVYAIPS
jgi:ABC-type dipeptide/oligopeptide/nickel transport system permease component